MIENEGTNDSGNDGGDGGEVADEAGGERAAPFSPEQTKLVSAIVKQRLAEERSRVARRGASAGGAPQQPVQLAQPAAPTAPAGFDYNQFAQALVAAQQAIAQPSAPTAAARPVAVAPGSSAGLGAVSPATQQGLLDIFNLNHQQIQQLGPNGMRQAFEAALSVGLEQAGVPRRPTTPVKR